MITYNIYIYIIIKKNVHIYIAIWIHTWIWIHGYIKGIIHSLAKASKKFVSCVNIGAQLCRYWKNFLPRIKF